MKPNLFDYATSELSQDAFLSWFVSFASSEFKNSYPLLHRASIEFLAELFELHDLMLPPIESIDIKKQFGSIDILIEINNQWAIMIEDKTFTKQHSNQLKRYRTHMHQERPHLHQVPIYLTINEQSNLQPVLDAGYQVYPRSQFLQLLNRHKHITSDIYQDYFTYLKKIDNSFFRYKDEPFNKWKDGSRVWFGVYESIRTAGIEGNYGYVANPRGGFNGFWSSLDIDHSLSPYILLEEQKLCVKIKTNDSEFGIKQLRSCSSYLIENIDELKRPSRLQVGKSMTVAVADYIITDSADIIDVDSTVRVIGSLKEKIRNLGLSPSANL
ncbi:hypothetical protein CEH05_16825 [Halobacillus halophilus]|uniref:PD-(D/E)XK nuclease superfamily protein n=1 Tax=Halobacillus halophilus (strain ATCC 35676 / DSM 2266 / JCM 20832 / KCTC 3685 / LMG 17431 / NBRC 102448 / NCIMB 2269) TaxID=866895 RepID=I0JRI3_HALH3|nr:PD-(D/E)XK nuclease family protein [Halobacillus halophilus]ASF40726.1 hypothetical protein CEH05_16825 [Halobacillus halophilus]CCG46754.1 conserved hypothetical protein [Halobacillus halophilus DSM 2266]